MSLHNATPIEYQRALYAKKSRADLIAIVQEYVEYSKEHIAARQLLDEMDRLERTESEKTEERRHREALAASHDANKIAKWAIVIAIAALIISVVQTFW